MGEGEGGKIWENSTETCILPYVKQTTSASSMHEAGASKPVLWDNTERWGGREVGGGGSGLGRCMCTCGWSMLMCAWGHHRDGKWLPSNKNKLKTKKNSFLVPLPVFTFSSLEAPLTGNPNYLFTSQYSRLLDGRAFLRHFWLSQFVWNSTWPVGGNQNTLC